MSKHTILFLAANPLGTDRLALDQEARAIQVELERSGHRDQFELVTRWAAEPLDLLRELRKLRPTVVHFSGHGGQLDPGEPGTRRPGGPRRDIGGGTAPVDEERQHGLFFQGADGRPQVVSTTALQDTFGAAGSSVRLVVLNACYSGAQARALLAHVDCVVGMGGSINDDAARSFAIGFYGGLGERESVAAAYKQGRAAISLEALRDSDRPQLEVRDGVDADQLVLAIDPPASAVAPRKRVDVRRARDELLSRLLALLPSQFEVVLFRMGIPPGYLPGSTAAQATRAMDAIRYLEQQDKLERLGQVIEDVVAAGSDGGGGDPR
ncbi:MAG TPA: CHAT domain-containing protein [Kofleriaceae bacterium]|nr:CHAT domain-containing protein [Kofleriaceae bacterium]